MDMSQYMEAFLAETSEHLQSLNENLLKLEKEPADIEVLNEIFRSAHTVKGMAATMGFHQITELTHEMESTLALFKDGTMKVNSDHIDLLLRCLDALETMAKAVEDGNELTDEFHPLLDELQKARQADAQPSAATTSTAAAQDVATVQEKSVLQFNKYDVHVLQTAWQSGYQAYYASIALAPGTVMGSVRAYMVFKAIEEAGQIIKCDPPAEDIEEERFNGKFELMFVSQSQLDFFTAALDKISEIEVKDLHRIEPDQLQTAAEDVIDHKSAETKKRE